MNSVTNEVQTRRPLPATVGTTGGSVVRRWLIAFLIAAVAFYRPLRDMVRFASHSELYSHTFLIPAISFYLVWIKRRSLLPSKSSIVGAAISYVFAAMIVGCYFASPTAPWWQIKVNYLSAMMLAMVGVCIGNLFLLLGKEFVRAALFPTLFLVLIAPFPQVVLDGLETFFQHSSAWTAALMFDITCTTVLHSGLFFQLPGITLEVAQECSGIHSSLVLIITALIAGYFFLPSYRYRLLMVFFVVPLGIVRNAFRIFVIGQLCAHVSPDMIHSYIHHHGGPIFFALSLVPFFILLHCLRKLESRKIQQCQTNVSVVAK
jgi:exosortase C (VPDSG-CTERM-specific)